MAQHRVQSDLETADFLPSAASPQKIMHLNGDEALITWGLTVPSGVAGYSKGAIFFHTDGSDKDDLLYINSGTSTSCTFVPATSVAGADFGATGMKTDVIAESTATSGVTIDSALIKDGGFTGEIITDSITEETANAGIALNDVLNMKVQTIAMNDAAVTLTSATLTGNVLFVDAESSGTEDLKLPPEAEQTGTVLFIFNTGGESIIVEDDAAGSVVTLETANTAICACDGTSWLGFVGVP